MLLHAPLRRPAPATKLAQKRHREDAEEDDPRAHLVHCRRLDALSLPLRLEPVVSRTDQVVDAACPSGNDQSSAAEGDGGDERPLAWLREPVAVVQQQLVGLAFRFAPRLAAKLRAVKLRLLRRRRKLCACPSRIDSTQPELDSAS